MRDSKADLIKGIGIIMVVLGHAGMPGSSILFRFHMALFFIISGYLFDERNINTFKNLIKYIFRRIKNLYIPFLIYNGIFTLLNNFFLKINFYTNNDDFLQISMGGGNSYGIKAYMSSSEIIAVLNQNLHFVWEQQFGGATWFLRVLFGVTVLWAISNFFIAKITKNIQMLVAFNWLLSILLLFISDYFQRENMHVLLQFETVAASYIMYCFGFYLKKIMKSEYNNDNQKLKSYLLVAICLISMVTLINCNTVCSLLRWNSNVNNYDYWAMYIISSLSGFICVFTVSVFLEKCEGVILKKIISLIMYAGKYSLYILTFHFIAFKAVTLIQIMIYQQPFYRLASFPCFITSKGWWLLYTFVGIIIPVWIGFIVQKSKNVIKYLRMQKNKM